MEHLLQFLACTWAPPSSCAFSNVPSYQITMKQSSHHQETVETQHTVRRYFKRREEPRRWWPLGIIPLLLLGLLFLVGLLVIAPEMQEDTASSVQSVLREAGYTTLTASADGQRVLIKGAADVNETTLIQRIARGAACDAFIARQLVCPTVVDVELDGKPVARYANFSFVRTLDGVVLRGEVPGEKTYQEVLQNARSRFGTVIDSLVIKTNVNDINYRWAEIKAWTLLENINTGRATWNDGVLSLTARTERANEQDVRDMFASTNYPERIGDLDLIFEEDVTECNTELEQALRESTIFFETASAVISDKSAQILADLAEIAATCPGNLIIEGHTDNQGDDQSNVVLSQQRANAVVAALVNLGIGTTRLSAIGYGESRPVASNETSRGRALNRRIAIRTADFN